MHGLKAAQRLDDLEGIQWATLGILSQAWTERAGRRLEDRPATWPRPPSSDSQATKAAEEAKEFEAALDEAVRRDCVVVVSWTGEADVDLLVEEPSGTVCSLRNPRTTAGGVMLGDSFARTATARAATATAKSTSARRVRRHLPRAASGGSGAR